MEIKKIWIGSDHGGWALKAELVAWLQSNNHLVEDVGAVQFEPADDYPVFAAKVGQALSALQEPVEQDPTQWGVLLCRSGAGMAIAANRFPFVRAVVCRQPEDARLARAHNNANVLVLEGDHVRAEAAQAIMSTFFSTSFDGGRHARRVQQLEQLHQLSQLPLAGNSHTEM